MWCLRVGLLLLLFFRQPTSFTRLFVSLLNSGLGGNLYWCSGPERCKILLMNDSLGGDRRWRVKITHRISHPSFHFLFHSDFYEWNSLFSSFCRPWVSMPGDLSSSALKNSPNNARIWRVKKIYSRIVELSSMEHGALWGSNHLDTHLYTARKREIKKNSFMKKYPHTRLGSGHNGTRVSRRLAVENSSLSVVVRDIELLCALECRKLWIINVKSSHCYTHVHSWVMWALFVFLSMNFSTVISPWFSCCCVIWIILHSNTLFIVHTRVG